MKNISLAINNITRQSISSYWWTLDLSESIYELVKEDFYENFGENVKIGWKKVKLSDCDFDFDYIDDLIEYQKDIFQNKVFQYIPDFCERLSKYGLFFKEFSIWKPKYYNYNDDELLIHFWYDENKDWMKENPELINIIQDYIDNIRIRSYDWYCSFESSNINEVDQSDYCYMYAVLVKEWILDDVKEAIKDAIEDIWSEYYELYQNPTLYYNWKYYKSEWDQKKDKCILQLVK